MLKHWQYLASPVLALFVSKVGKVITYYRSERKAARLSDVLFKSGGMPSDHSATVASITTVVGLTQGIRSPLFAVCVVFAIIVLHDSCHVRLSVGLQGEALKSIMPSSKKRNTFPINHGHKTSEVLVGVSIGVIVGVVIFFLS